MIVGMFENGEKTDKKKVNYCKRQGKKKLGTISLEVLEKNKMASFINNQDDFEVKKIESIQVKDNFIYSEQNGNHETSNFIVEITEQLLPAEKMKLNISPDDFEYLKVIGKGYFGKVMKVKYKGDQEIYALKTIKKSKLKQQKHIEHIRYERKILESIDHPFIISLKFAFQTATKLYIVMEFCNGGELFYHIRKKGRFSTEEARFYFSQIVLAIEYLHSKKIIYRDLKPENLVLDNRGYIKLTDLGLAKDNIQEDSTTQTFCGTPEYLAPEIIRGEKYGKAVDVWCLGIILYEMIFGFPPFYDKMRERMYKKIIFNEPEFNRIPNIVISSETKDLLLKLLQKNPKQRPKIQAIKSHPFFNNFDFNDLIQLKMPPIFKPDIETESKFIDPGLNNEKPEDSLYNGLSPLNVKNFEEFTYANKNLVGK